MLCLLLNRPNLRDSLGEFSPEYLSNSANREIYSRWLECADFDDLQTSLDEPLFSHLQSLSAMDLVTTDSLESERELEQCMKQLKRRHLLALQEVLLTTVDNSTPPPRDLMEEITSINEAIRATEKSLPP